MTSPLTILSFYNREPLEGASEDWKTLDDVLAFDDKTMERCHNYIQWVFPIPEPSQFNYQAPVLTPEVAGHFKEDEELRGRVGLVFDRWMKFLRGTDHWVRLRDHNHLRITRSLRFLVLTGFEGEAKELYEMVCDRMMEDGRLTQETYRYWRGALLNTGF